MLPSPYPHPAVGNCSSFRVTGGLGGDFVCVGFLWCFGFVGILGGFVCLLFCEFWVVVWFLFWAFFVPFLWVWFLFLRKNTKRFTFSISALLNISRGSLDLPCSNTCLVFPIL